jgi:hypothetical protein
MRSLGRAMSARAMRTRCRSPCESTPQARRSSPAAPDRRSCVRARRACARAAPLPLRHGGPRARSLCAAAPPLPQALSGCAPATSCQQLCRPPEPCPGPWQLQSSLPSAGRQQRRSAA